MRAGHFREGGRTLVAEAFYDPPTQMLSKDLHGNVSATYGFAAQAAVVEVSEATGQVRVRAIVSAHDVGRALNPLAAEGQIHGGIHMGLGYALSEELVIREGRVLNPQLMEYALFPVSDMPAIAVKLIETVDEAGPFGAKGLGESGVIPVCRRRRQRRQGRDRRAAHRAAHDARARLPRPRARAGGRAGGSR